MDYEAHFCERCSLNEHSCKDSWQTEGWIYEMDVHYSDDEGNIRWSQDCFSALVSAERAGEIAYPQSWSLNRELLHGIIRNQPSHRYW
jgi:hypothetical protein